MDLVCTCQVTIGWKVQFVVNLRDGEEEIENWTLGEREMKGKEGEGSGKGREGRTQSERRERRKGTKKGGW